MFDPFSFVFSLIFSLWWLILPWLLTLIVWEKFIDSLAYKNIKVFIEKNGKYTFLKLKFSGDFLINPKLMEEVLIYLHANIQKEKYPEFEAIFKGKVPLPYFFIFKFHDRNLELIIGITENILDLLKTSLYSKYPEISFEIVENPLNDTPKDLPNFLYDIFPFGFNLKRSYAYPLKTYIYLEKLPEEERVDPLSGIWELNDNISNKEWLFLIIYALPIDGDDWVPKAKEEIEKFLGIPPKPQPITLKEEIEEFIKNLLIAPFKYPEWKTIPQESSFEFSLQKLTPLQREILEAMERKTTKFGYLCSLLGIYIATKDLFDSGKNNLILKIVDGIFGSMGGEIFNDFSVEPKIKKGKVKFEGEVKVEEKEFMSEFKNYFLKSYYSKRINLNYYDFFRFKFLRPRFVLTTEELATIFHHPLKQKRGEFSVKIKKTKPPFEIPTI
ncbi:MAG: hypothetical protein C4348_01375 [Patescibacteria group bacterium]